MFLSHLRPSRAMRRRVLATAFLVALGLVVTAAATDGRAPRKAPAPPAPVAPAVPETPEIQGTPANLQEAFANETNAAQRYTAFARQAVADSQPGVARLFRACALAESVHARRFVQAIAYNRQPARALLERLTIGTTGANLETAIALERREVETWYPALLARARADGQSMAVRALTLALGAERTHLALLEDARARLDQHPPFATLHVCPYCGRVTTSHEYTKCPACFTDTARFLRPA